MKQLVTVQLVSVQSNQDVKGSMRLNATKLQQLLVMGYLHGSGSANGQFITLVSEVLSEGLNSLEVFVSVSTHFTHGYATTTYGQIHPCTLIFS